MNELIGAPTALSLLGIIHTTINGNGEFLYDKKYIELLADRIKKSFAEDEIISEWEAKTCKKGYYGF
jgi:hypothetical protein